MILRYEKRKTECKLRDLIVRPIRTTAAVIATPVVRESQLLREEAIRHVKTEDAPRIEIETDHGTDHEIDRETDREIDHAIDHEIGIEGKIYKSNSIFYSILYFVF